MYPKGYYMNFMADLKDMVKYHRYQMSELLDLTPFDYQVIKLMIADDLSKEIESRNNGIG